MFSPIRLLYFGLIVRLALGELESHADVAPLAPSSPHPRATYIPHFETTPDLNLPPHLNQRFRDRSVIDAYQSRHHQVAPGIIPTPKKLTPTTSRVAQPLKVVRPALPEAVLKYRRLHGEPLTPLRGFRAPILQDASADWAVLLPTNRLTQAEVEVAGLIEKRLARDGLLPILAKAVERLGPRTVANHPKRGLDRLQTLGYPVDLLRHFPMEMSATSSDNATAVLNYVCQKLLPGGDADLLGNELSKLRFEFSSGTPASLVSPSAVSTQRFRAASECGTHDVGLIRMQMGGGWNDGIVPGGSIDVINQIVEAFRTVDILISVDAALIDSVRWMATNSWRLRRNEQVTLVAEELSPSAWAQDNGKAGILDRGPNQSPQWATLVPRYASIGEGSSTYSPAESYVADGLRAAGHAVIQSSLLFQGGNVLMFVDPKSEQPVLLIGEGEIARNVTLGLSRDQILEAFRREFGVERAVLVPGVSYHLDFDISIRRSNNELVVFVNDPASAAHHIVELGIDTLGRHGLLSASDVSRAKSALQAKDHRMAVSILQAPLTSYVVGSNTYSASLSRAFIADPSDDATGNLQTFLLALDVLESQARGAIGNSTPERREYLRALRNMGEARLVQLEAIQRLGFKVVAVPSMPDLLRSINYLNGIQLPSAYVMPVFGGFYSSLDRAAIAEMQKHLGPARIIPIKSAECQRRFGGVHCTTVAYPRLPQPTVESLNR